MGDRDRVVRFDSRIGTVGDLRSGVGTVRGLRSETLGGLRSGFSGFRVGSRVRESVVAGKALQVDGKMLQIGSIYEFPTLCDNSIGVHDIMSHHRSVNSHAVAIDTAKQQHQQQQDQKHMHVRRRQQDQEHMHGQERH